MCEGFNLGYTDTDASGTFDASVSERLVPLRSRPQYSQSLFPPGVTHLDVT